MGSFAFFFPNNAMTSFFICEMFFNQWTFHYFYREIKVNTVTTNKENKHVKSNVCGCSL